MRVFICVPCCRSLNFSLMGSDMPRVRNGWAAGGKGGKALWTMPSQEDLSKRAHPQIIFLFLFFSYACLLTGTTAAAAAAGAVLAWLVPQASCLCFLCVRDRQFGS